MSVDNSIILYPNDDKAREGLCQHILEQIHRKQSGFKTLALLFLVLLGGLLMAEGFVIHINKGYVYFAMAFGLVLEMCHIQLKKKQRPVIQRIRPIRPRSIALQVR